MCGHDFTEENDHKQDEERSLLLHGIPSDWVEEEMMDDDVDFIRDVLEQKVIKCLENVGIKKRVRSLTKDIGQWLNLVLCSQIDISGTFRWKEGPAHRNVKPVVIVFARP